MDGVDVPDDGGVTSGMSATSAVDIPGKAGHANASEASSCPLVTLPQSSQPRLPV